MQRSSRPEMTGRSKIYNYDEWTKNHYTKLFKKKQEWKRNRNYENVFQFSSGNNDKDPAYNEQFVIYALAAIITIFIAFGIESSLNSNDRVRTVTKPPQEQNDID